MTSNSGKLSQCFKSNGEFLTQAAQLENTLKGFFQQLFHKIRGKKTKKLQDRGRRTFRTKKKIKSFC